MCDSDCCWEIMALPCTMCGIFCTYVAAEMCVHCCRICHEAEKDKMKRGSPTTKSATTSTSTTKNHTQSADNATTTTTGATTTTSGAVETEKMERPFEKATMAFPK
mmetsp:Transcript_19702/g.27875  ORF Transcript_19702/g.27875 Transcript_19702/m.27875 type:complete len:106 (+) Transcript_19702:271-588(+)